MKIIHDFFCARARSGMHVTRGLWFMGGGFFHRLAEGLPAMPVRVPMWVQAYVVYMWGMCEHVGCALALELR